MRRISIFILLVSSIIYAQQPGDLVSAELKLDVSPGGLINWINQNTDEEIDPDFITYLQNVPIGMQGYKLTYKSLDYNDNMVNATGLVLFPKTNKKLSQVLFMAPTTDNRNYVPSNLLGTARFGIALPIIISAAEYIVIAPDYLGMGTGDGRLAYVEDKEAAAAGLDMLKAAGQFLDQIGKQRYEEYFVGGYSQGGHAAMSVVKWNQEHDRAYNFRYLAGGAGPYDLSGATLQDGVIDKTEFPNSAFIAYVIYTCNNIGFPQFQNSWNEVISDEYYDQFIASTDGEEGGLDWGPNVWRELFKPNFIQAVESDYNHPARQCARSNDVFDFKNLTPTTMYSSWFDKTINPENDEVTLNTQRGYYRWWDLNKYKIQKAGLGPWNHGIGSVPYTFAAIYKFNTLRRGGFFNFWAANTGEYNRPANNETSLDFIPSSVAPKLVGSATSLTQKGVKETSFESIEELKSLQKNVSLIKTQLADGTQKIFPIVKETAIEIEAREVLTIKGNDLNLNMSSWSGNIQALNLVKNNEVIQTIQNQNQQKEFNFDLKQLPNFDAIEVIADATIFMVKKPENQIKDVENEVYAVNSAQGVKVISNQEMQQIHIYDNGGNAIMSNKNVLDKETELSLRKGLYLIKVIMQDGSIETLKFIKK